RHQPGERQRVGGLDEQRPLAVEHADRLGLVDQAQDRFAAREVAVVDWPHGQDRRQPRLQARPPPAARAGSLRCTMDPAALRNRLLVVTGMWRDATEEPLPKLPPGDPEAQIEAFELQVVDLMFAEATPESARRVADRTWDLVHDRPDDDP